MIYRYSRLDSGRKELPVASIAIELVISIRKQRLLAFFKILLFFHLPVHFLYHLQGLFS